MKHIKHIILFSFLFISTLVVGQERRESLEKIKALKTAYITEELDLTPAEAQKFWPIYNLHNDKLHALKENYKKNMRGKLKEIGSVDNLSEADAKKLVEFKISNEKEIHKEEYLVIKELSEVISQKKIVKLQIAEYEFRKKLIGKLRGKRRE